MVYQLLIPSLILAAATILASVIAYIYRRKKGRELADTESDTDSDHAHSDHSGETENTYVTILPTDSHLSIANINYTEDGKVIVTDFPTKINTTRTSTNSLTTSISSLSANGVKAGLPVYGTRFQIPAAGSGEAVMDSSVTEKSHMPNYYQNTQKIRMARHSHHGNGKSGHSTYRYNHFNKSKHEDRSQGNIITRTTSAEITKNFRSAGPIERLVVARDPAMHRAAMGRDLPPFRRMNSNGSGNSLNHGHVISASPHCSKVERAGADKIPVPPPTNTYFSNNMSRHMKRNNSLVGPGSGNDCDTQSHLSDGCASGVSNSNNSVKSLPEFIPNYDSLNIRVETNRASLKLSNFTLPPLGTGGSPGSCSGSVRRGRHQSNESDASSNLGTCR